MGEDHEDARLKQMDIISQEKSGIESFMLVKS